MRAFRATMLSIGIALCAAPMAFMAADAGAKAAGTLAVGVAKTDITPVTPIRLSGYGSRRAESEGVDQKLWAKALAIGADDESPVVLITVDLIGVPGALTDALAERLAESAGVGRERLAVCATHTHTGPSIDGVLPFMFSGEITPAEEERIAKYTEGLAEKLHALALAALKDRRPGRLEWAQGSVALGENRRAIVNGKWAGFGGNPDGPVDHALPVLKVSGEDGETRAIFTSHACHCTTFNGKHNRIHGDWAGSAAAAMERDHPGAIAMVAAGCGGDQNPALKGNEGVAEKNGALIAAEVKRVLAGTLHPVTRVPVGAYERVELPFDHVVTRAELEKRVASGRKQAQYHAGVMLERLDRGIAPPASMPYALQTWVFGDDLAMVFLAGEVVVDYSLRLKRELDADRLWVNAYANDVPSYIASKRIMPEGGYEVDASMDYYGKPVRFAVEIEDRVISAVHEMIPDGFNAKPKTGEAAGAAAGPDALPPPKSREDSLAAITVRPGMVVELVAAEPLVMDPIDIAWGPDGKMWVVEMADYPLGVDGKGKPGGRVRFLEDADGDGRYDKSTLFADGLNFPTGVMPWRDGVLVTAAPEILFLKDTDGDGLADKQAVLYRGFVEGNQQHRVNGLRWGLDNWIHIANGDSGGKIESMLTGDSVDISGRDLRIRPDDGGIEAETGRTQYGRNRDDWGNWFGCNNSNPMWHFVHADRYLRRNPHLAAAGATRHLQKRAAPVFPVSETLARFNRPESANRFTSACGAMIYRDVLLGEGFYGNSFVAEPVHNLVHREILTPEGASFSSRRAADEKESEFFASADHWCRPVAVKTGPDGALWIVDMYRAVIEHPEWIPDDWEARLDLRAGEDKGRIYRVYPDGVEPRPIPILDRQKGLDCVRALGSLNGCLRDTAHRLIVEERNPRIRDEVEKVVKEGDDPLSRMQALCALDGLDEMTSSASQRALLAALEDPHPGVRRQAVRLSEKVAESMPALVEVLWALAEDPDPAVRLQLAYSLAEWSGARAGDALARLAVAHADDADLRTAVMSSAPPHLDQLVNAVLAGGGNAEARRGLARDLTSLAAATGNEPVIAKLLARLIEESEGSAELFASLAETADTLSQRKITLRQLHDGAGNDLKPILAKISDYVDAARATATNPSAPLARRKAAVALLGRGMRGQAEDVALLADLLGAGVSPELKLAVVESLAGLGRKETPALLLDGWAGHSPAVRGAALDLILSRSHWVPAFFDAAEKRPELLAALGASRRQALIEYPSKAVRERAQEALGREIVTDRAKVVTRYLEAARIAGDAERGEAVFAAACAACHRLGEAGREIGPDLAALTDKSPEALLVAIVDPNRAREDKFTQYVAETADGRTLSGMIVEESGNSVTLLGIDGVPQTIPVADLKSLVSTGKSLMPEGLEAALDVRQMADVIAFVAESEGAE